MSYVIFLGRGGQLKRRDHDSRLRIGGRFGVEVSVRFEADSRLGSGVASDIETVGAI